MAGLVLTPADRVQLLRLMRRQLNSHVHRRMNVLLLLDDSWTAEAIARALCIDAETVREHRGLYERAGVRGLETLSYAGAEPALSAEQRAALEAEHAAKLYGTAKAVCGLVRERFTVSYTPHAMAKLLGAARLCLQEAGSRARQGRPCGAAGLFGTNAAALEGRGRAGAAFAFR